MAANQIITLYSSYLNSAVPKSKNICFTADSSGSVKIRFGSFSNIPVVCAIQIDVKMFSATSPYNAITDVFGRIYVPYMQDIGIDPILSDGTGGITASVLSSGPRTLVIGSNNPLQLMMMSFNIYVRDNSGFIPSTSLTNPFILLPASIAGTNKSFRTATATDFAKMYIGLDTAGSGDTKMNYVCSYVATASTLLDQGLGGNKTTMGTFIVNINEISTPNNDSVVAECSTLACTKNNNNNNNIAFAKLSSDAAALAVNVSGTPDFIPMYFTFDRVTNDYANSTLSDVAGADGIYNYTNTYTNSTTQVFQFTTNTNNQAFFQLLAESSQKSMIPPTQNDFFVYKFIISSQTNSFDKNPLGVFYVYLSNKVITYNFEVSNSTVSGSVDQSNNILTVTCTGNSNRAYICTVIRLIDTSTAIQATVTYD
jgi:hypothetical protein